MVWADPAAVPTLRGHNITHFNKHLQNPFFYVRSNILSPRNLQGDGVDKMLTEKIISGSRKLSPKLCGRAACPSGSRRVRGPVWVDGSQENPEERWNFIKLAGWVAGMCADSKEGEAPSRSILSFSWHCSSMCQGSLGHSVPTFLQMLSYYFKSAFIHVFLVNESAIFFRKDRLSTHYFLSMWS